MRKLLLDKVNRNNFQAVKDNFTDNDVNLRVNRQYILDNNVYNYKLLTGKRRLDKDEEIFDFFLTDGQEFYFLEALRIIKSLWKAKKSISADIVKNETYKGVDEKGDIIAYYNNLKSKFYKNTGNKLCFGSFLKKTCYALDLNIKYKGKTIINISVLPHRNNRMTSKYCPKTNILSVYFNSPAVLQAEECKCMFYELMSIQLPRLIQFYTDKDLFK